MMYAWSFPVHSADDVARLLRALSKHRYVREVDHRLHYLVDRALLEEPGFDDHARSFAELERAIPELDLRSRDPRLWRPATLDDLARVFASFWNDTPEARQNRERLQAMALATGFEWPAHEPWASPPEEPSHPDLVVLDWVLFPIDELDAERHAGALGALEEAGEEVDLSAPIYQEATAIGLPELCDGATEGELVGEFVVWSDAPYAYARYVFLGAAKAAKLEGPPEGYRDIDGEGAA